MTISPVDPGAPRQLVADSFTAPGDEVERMMFGWERAAGVLVQIGFPPRPRPLIDQERSAAADHRHHCATSSWRSTTVPPACTPSRHSRPLVPQPGSNTSAATGFVRDIRDLLAASQLENRQLSLRARAAERAGHPDTATLAHQLRAQEHTAPERLRAELDSALEIALLAE